jgi:hypothetical protein
MEGAQSDTVAIMAAIIYASRTKQAGASDPKTYAAIAQEAWDLHKAVLGSGEVRTNRAGF